ncbi:MAG: hypothetical protein K2J66_09620 [Muribaculaceae bacterium]|nr:hypothetical protein [Muribaculaceae bacterium]
MERASVIAAVMRFGLCHCKSQQNKNSHDFEFGMEKMLNFAAVFRVRV